MKQTHIESKAARQAAVAARHPRALAPSNLILTLVLSAFGAVVGIQVLVTLGITPSTSQIGALAAMTLARIPLQAFRGFRNVHAQNLAQTSISSATFGAANSLLLPIGIPFLFGLPQMIAPMLVGVSLAMLLDAWLLYRMFGTSAFPATGAWPLGIAAAESIKAGDQGGRQAVVLLGGLLTGAAGSVLSLPMSAFGVALIGSLGAMVAFAMGLLLRGYSTALFHVEIAKLYAPQGMMIGAGIIALIQMARMVIGQSVAPRTSDAVSKGADGLGRSLSLGATGYIAITVALAIATGIYVSMSPGLLVLFVLYAAAAAFVHELIVGIAAMHSGWFPAFAVAMITLLLGILVGFPPEALVVLSGFTAATGPAFADMGYDLKAGYLLRGEGADVEFEREGRRQQLIAGMLGFVVAIAVVSVSYPLLFRHHQTPPIDAAYVAAIRAGISAEAARSLAMWAIPGAVLQLVGGSGKQLGILFATGLLIAAPTAGWLVVAGIVVRLCARRLLGDEGTKQLQVFAGGVIAGDAVFGFFSGAVRSFRK